MRLDICNIGRSIESLKVAGWLEYNRSSFRPQPEAERALFPNAPSRSGTSFGIPRTLGLGIEGDERQLGKDRFRHRNPPMLERRDGAHTNR